MNSENELMINVVLKTSSNRGDHVADITVAVTVTPEMSVKQLIDKCFVDGIKLKNGMYEIGSELTDHIEIRIAH